ncbi:MAG: PQQ-binding-like beta-propeller repeat protein [Alphaproteobacteria bacterium]|nr:PQQ-binding-like beta-propeller repeat protein [Alphaproteobacteria bacterium]
MRLLLALAACVGLALVACGGKDKGAHLPGDRTPVITLAPRLSAGADGTAPVPAVRAPVDWPMPGGSPAHAPGHPPLAAKGLARPAWSAAIGQGASRRAPLTAQPVVAGGQVFTMDAGGVVRAFDAATGRAAWSAPTREKGQDPHPVGGIALGGGKVYATTGGAAVVALDAGTGQETWRAALPAPARAAPTPFEDIVFVVTLDARLIALSAADGAQMWGQRGLTPDVTHLTASPPTVTDGAVYAALPGGGIVAAEARDGNPLWSAAHAPVTAALGGPAGAVADVAAPLVLTPGGLVLALGTGGKLAALDAATGAPAWTQPIGGMQMPWLAGSTVFVLGDGGVLAALAASDGQVLWSRALPVVETEKKDPEDEDPLLWYGPVLAGGRLILAGSDGRVATFAPDTGQPLDEVRLGARIAQPPVTAGGRLYLLTEAGRVLAF